MPQLLPRQTKVSPLRRRPTRMVRGLVVLSFAFLLFVGVGTVAAAVKIVNPTLFHSLTGNVFADETEQEAVNKKVVQTESRSKVLGESIANPLLQFNVPATFTAVINAASVLVSGETTLEGAVNANSTLDVDGVSTFNDDVIIQGDLILNSNFQGNGITIDVGDGELLSSNVVYSVVAGGGISVSGDQDITIENTDKGSEQKIFKTIKVGGDSFSAGSNTDTLTVAAGDGISVGIDTSNKKLTISSSGGDVTSIVGDRNYTDSLVLTDSETITASLDDLNVAIGNRTYAGATSLTSSQSITASLLALDTAIAEAGGHSAVTLAGSYDYLTLSGQQITLGQIDLTTDVTGVLPIANGGTGASSLSNLITLATHTTGNYVGTIADSGSSIISVSGSGSENAAITLGIAADSLNFTELADTLTLDASTSITLDGTEDLTISNSGTGNFIIDLTSTGDFVIKDNSTIFATFSDTGTVVFTGTLQANDYYSGDGTQGATTTVSGLVFKDGLYTTGLFSGFDNYQYWTLTDGSTSTNLTTTATLTLSDDNLVNAVVGSGTLALSIGADALDFSEFKDSLALDASTDIAVDNAEVFSITNTGTGNSFVVNDASADETPFLISAAGNVSIGTTTAANLLSIYNAGASDTIAAVIGTNGTYSSGLSIKSGAGVTWNIISQESYASNALLFGQGGSYPLALTTGGNFGIGTTTVGSRLVVQAASTEDIATFKDSDGTSRLTVTNDGYIDLSGTDLPNTFNQVFKINNALTGISEGFGGFGNGFLKISGSGRSFANFIADTSVNSLFSGGVENEGYRRFAITGDGTFNIGDGTTAWDSTIGRATGSGISISGTNFILSGTTTMTASSLTALNCSDCIDFDDFADSATLDANFALSQSTNTWTQSYTGTTTTGYTYNANSLTTASAMALNVNGLSTGKGLDIQSTSTALSTGSLTNLYWNPASSTIATGDLFKITIGANAILNGNLLALYNNSSSVFRVGTAQINSDVPHSFNAAGDVSVAYDLTFTNQTAAAITSNGPLTLIAGEAFENNDLNLQAYGTGKINLINSGLGIQTGEKIIFDTDDTGDSYLSHSNGSNYVSFFADGTEAARFKSDGAVDGNTTFNANAFDLAEYYPTKDSTVEAGDVVSIAPKTESDSAATDSPYLVEKTSQNSIGQVIGVVSTKPGFVLGGGSFRSEMCTEVMQDDGEDRVRQKLIERELGIMSSDTTTSTASGSGTIHSTATRSAQLASGSTASDSSKLAYDEDDLSDAQIATIEDKIQTCKAISSVPIALAGRVPVKVDPAHAAEIKTGDLLMASPTAPGKAMKASAAGWVIGRALEDYNKDNDTIMTFVFVTYYNGGSTNALVKVAPTAPIKLPESLGEVLGISVDLNDNPYLLSYANFNVTGDVTATTMTATSQIIAGNLTIDSTDNSITSIADSSLKLQTDSFAGAVDIFNGKIIFNTDGEIITLSDIQAKMIGAENFMIKTTKDASGKDTSSVGVGTLKAGSKEAQISNQNVTVTSKIFVTPRTSTKGQVLYVSDVEQNKFTVNIDTALTTDLLFDYWILGVQ